MRREDHSVSCCSPAVTTLCPGDGTVSQELLRSEGFCLCAWLRLPAEKHSPQIQHTLYASATYGMGQLQAASPTSYLLTPECRGCQDLSTPCQQSHHSNAAERSRGRSRLQGLGERAHKTRLLQDCRALRSTARTPAATAALVQTSPQSLQCLEAEHGSLDLALQTWGQTRAARSEVWETSCEGARPRSWQLAAAAFASLRHRAPGGPLHTDPQRVQGENLYLPTAPRSQGVS